MKKIWYILVFVLLVATGLFVSTANATKGHDKIAFCHKVEGNGNTGNGYNIIKTDPASIIKKGHGSHSGDIIPAFDGFSGLGDASWIANDCKAPGTDPEPTPEPTKTTPTSVPTDPEPTETTPTSVPTDPEPTETAPTSVPTDTPTDTSDKPSVDNPKVDKTSDNLPATGVPEFAKLLLAVLGLVLVSAGITLLMAQRKQSK